MIAITHKNMCECEPVSFSTDWIYSKSNVHCCRASGLSSVGFFSLLCVTYFPFEFSFLFSLSLAHSSTSNRTLILSTILCCFSSQISLENVLRAVDVNDGKSYAFYCLDAIHSWFWCRQFNFFIRFVIVVVAIQMWNVFMTWLWWCYDTSANI